MKRKSISYGIIVVLILFTFSLILLFISRSCDSPFLCAPGLLFLIINFPGTLVLLLISYLGLLQFDLTSTPSNSLIFLSRSLVILFSVPLHFIIGAIIGGLKK